MARTISLTHEGAVSHFSFAKLDRKKLYPTRRREALDAEGQKCTRGELLDDGRTVITSGMTGQGYFAESGEWVPNSELVGINSDGSQAELAPSTLGTPQEIARVTPDDLLSVKAQTVYMLEPVELDDALLKEVDEGAIFRFPFNMRADYHAETGYLLKNSQGYFAVFGETVESTWVELESYAEASDEAESSDDDNDELDFDMF